MNGAERQSTSWGKFPASGLHPCKGTGSRHLFHEPGKGLLLSPNYIEEKVYSSTYSQFWDFMFPSILGVPPLEINFTGKYDMYVFKSVRAQIHTALVPSSFC